MGSSDTRYFATLPAYSVELASALMDKVDRFYAWLPGSIWYRRCRRAWQIYYGMPGEVSPFDVSVVGVAGEQGELTQVHVNHFYALGQRLLTMVVGQKPGWQPVATNSDHQSQAQAILASAVLDYELRSKRLDRVLMKAAETAFIYSSGWYLPEWDARGGQVYAVDPTTKAPVYEGRLKVGNYTPLDVIFDVRRKDEAHDWVIVKRMVNKFDLATRYPQQEQKILRLEPDHREIQEWRRISSRTMLETEQVPLYSFFHRPTDAVPAGRQVDFITADVVLFDGPSVYGESLPLREMSSGYVLGTPFGFSPGVNIIALQELYNSLISAAATNNVNCGVSNIAMRADADLSPTQLAGGMNVWEVAGNPSEMVAAINLTHTAPETFQMAQIIKQTMIELVGQNDVSMGNIDAKLSGAAMALLDAKALQYASLFQASWKRAVEDLGTSILDLYKRFAKTPRDLEAIVGESRSVLLKDFVGDSISTIRRVVVESKSPLTDSTSGRMDLVEKLTASGALQGPSAARAIVTVYQTGSLDAVLEGAERETLLIKSENEALSKGQPPPALATDNHIRHIHEHDVVLGSPEARANPQIVQAVLAHNQQHVELWRSTDPALLAALGIPPPPAPPPPPMPMGPPGMPPGPPGPPGAPPPGPQGPPPHVPPPGPTPPNVRMPEPPKPPKNPSTGQPYMPPIPGA